MRTLLHLKSPYFLSSLILMITLISCGTYQGTSYYASDGIYGGEAAVKKRPAPSQRNSNGVYYKDYFNNIADDYSSLDDSQGQVFTDTDNYSNQNGNNNVRVNSQAPWGDRTTRTEIYYINNNPWGYFNFNWGFYNSFYDPFWGYSPFFYRGFNRPYWGLSFYDPFFNFGFGYYGHPFFGPRYRYGYGGYYGNRYDRGYAYSAYSRGGGRSYNSNNSRLGRAQQSYSNSGSSRSSSYQNGNTDASNTNRYNVGRRSSNQSYSNGSNQVNRSNGSSNSRTSNYSNPTRSNSSRNYSNSASRSNSNYNSGRSYNSSRSYSNGGRSSSYSSGSRGYSGGGRSSSRGR